MASSLTKGAMWRDSGFVQSLYRHDKTVPNLRRLVIDVYFDMGTRLDSTTELAVTKNQWIYVDRVGIAWE